MGYISDLRRYVGHKPIIHTCGSVICENGAREILLQKRLDDGTWGYCGGSMEPGETPEETAKRELLEETGLTALSLTLFGVYGGEALHHIYPNGDEVYTVDIVYICKEWQGTLKMQESEVTELKFFDIGSLPENICPPARLPMKEYTDYRMRDKLF